MRDCTRYKQDAWRQYRKEELGTVLYDQVIQKDVRIV